MAEYADGIGPDYHMPVAAPPKGNNNIKLTGMVQRRASNKMVVHPADTVRADQLPDYATDVNQRCTTSWYNKQAGVDGCSPTSRISAVMFLQKMTKGLP